MTVSRIPRVTLHVINNYLRERIPPGDFVRAVLENDLRAACLMADDHNRHVLWEIVRYLYNTAPVGSWGSPENVQRWLSGEGPELGEVEQLFNEARERNLRELRHREED